jgi:hypothetical protein
MAPASPHKVAIATGRAMHNRGVRERADVWMLEGCIGHALALLLTVVG